VGIKTAITLDIVRRFREEGIRIPYNRLEVVMLDPHADDDAPADGQPKGSSAAV
ncbi:MAG: transporter, partial [Sutterella sp.]|nr:transporter [Sutterella sp.]